MENRTAIASNRNGMSMAEHLVSDDLLMWSSARSTGDSTCGDRTGEVQCTPGVDRITGSKGTKLLLKQEPLLLNTEQTRYTLHYYEPQVARRPRTITQREHEVVETGSMRNVCEWGGMVYRVMVCRKQADANAR